jgi:enamine deaminase RidA (YjgF/YER057c/UK114 family)
VTTADERLANAELSAAPPGARPSLRPFGAVGSLLITSGQVAARDGVLLATGTVGDLVDLATARDCARQCVRNCLDAVRAVLGSLEPVAAVVRLTVYVASADGFHDQHVVADAATDLLHEVFGDRGAHARTALGLRALPLGSPVEAELVLSVREPAN